MSLVLHKVAVLSDEEDSHQFTFVFDSPQKLLEAKSIESTEIQYGGHSWSVVCMRKDDNHLGMFLKWRYGDGNSASAVSSKCKYFLSLVHRHDYRENRHFLTTQKFTTAQPLLGKSKFIPLDELLDQSCGYLDSTGKNVVVELGFNQCSTRFESRVDVSPSNRTRKNASGVYFDAMTFLLAGHRWYVRFYTTKTNSNGLPAVYLYLSGKARGVSIELRFTLGLCNDSTEILVYNFGEGAKFDGFGKTLPEPLANVNKLTEVTVSVEVTSLMIYKCAGVRYHRPPLQSNSPFSSRFQFNKGDNNGSYGGGSSQPAAETFQDHDGNFWKVDLVRDAQKLAVVVDKGVHHFPNNKTKIVCWSSVLLSLDSQRASDVNMHGYPVVGYLSNFTDEKGYVMTFPIRQSQLEEPGNPYVTDSGEMFIRINFLSLQVTPLTVRSGPRFEYQLNHLLCARQELQENHRSLQEMREMSASHASLSMLDDPPMSESSLSSEQTGTGHGGRMHSSKSFESLDGLSTGDPVNLPDDESHRLFYSDLLQAFANSSGDKKSSSDDDDVWSTSRCDVPGSVREEEIAAAADGGTNGAPLVGDDSSLIADARSNCSAHETTRQWEIVKNLSKYLEQRLPFRVSEVLESGSLGSGTVTKSRVDVDLILLSQDVPKHGQRFWMPALLECIKNCIMQGSNNQDPFYPIARCHDFSVSSSALQFTCDGGVDVDVIVTYDWESAGGVGGSYDALYDVSCKEVKKDEKIWYKLASSKLQQKFLFDQPNEVKEVIKVIKHWRNCIRWKKTAYRPNSYLLSLLVVKAYEETRSFDIKRIIQRVASYVLAAELSLSWSLYYLPEKYPVDFDPPTPLVRDPTNPAINVADTLSYWGQLKTEFATWTRSLGITVSPLGSVLSRKVRFENHTPDTDDTDSGVNV